MVTAAEQAKMSALKATEQANKDVVKAAKQAKQALTEVRKYKNCAEHAIAKEEAKKLNWLTIKAVMDSPFKEQHENWKNTFIEQCLSILKSI